MITNRRKPLLWGNLILLKSICALHGKTSCVLGCLYQLLHQLAPNEFFYMNHLVV
jgi:hypothetical protein